MKSRGSLRTKIITWSFVPTVIILTTVALVTFYSYQQVTNDLVISQSAEVGRFKRGQVQNVLNEMINPTMYDYFIFLDTKKELNLFDQARSLENSQLQESEFSEVIVFLDKNGKVLYSESSHPEWVGISWAHRDFFLDAKRMEGINVVIGRLFEDRKTGEFLLPFAVKLRDDKGDFSGVAVLCFRFNSSQNNMFVQNLYSEFADQKVIILDSSQRVIYHYDPTLIGQKLTEREEINPLFDITNEIKDDQVKTYRTADGRTVISAAFLETSYSNGWWVIQEQSWKELMEPSLAYRRLLIILLAAGVFVPVLVVTYGARHITRPIEEMIKAAKEVAGGKFGRTIISESNDELDELATQFNRMSSQLDQSYTLLEKRVADRTHELETINAISDVVNRSLDLNLILNNALQKTLEITNMDAGVAYRLNQGSQMFELLAHHGFSSEYIQNHRFLPFSLTGFKSNDENPDIIVAYVKDYPVPSLKEDLEKEGIQVAVRLPLMFKGKMLGYLGLSRHNTEFVTEDEIKMFKAIGQQISIAIENSQLYEQAEESAATAERNRLARDLHDAVTQTLFSVSLIADVLPELYKINPDEAKKRTNELRDLSRGALAEMRTLLLELRPSALASVSLPDLLKQLCDAANGRALLPIKFHVEGDRELPEPQKIALYRMTQEAINNIIKYAQATQASVELIQAKEFVEIAIRDNGVGFQMDEVEPYRMGLRIMQERASVIDAELRVVSNPG
ncbi:MAG TPA: histidine kinase, partial [Anaerolineaceae bacterium]|nr:histidine kinase [Anaerolineaceae bacterium]